MSKFKFKPLVKVIQSGIIKHCPTILTAMGITGLISTTVMAVSVTPKAVERIKQDSKKKHNGDPYGYTKMEAVKSAWTCYVPAAVTCASSVACILCANSVNSGRNAVLATAYKLSETALTEYKDKVVDTLGEKKEKTIRESIAQDRIDNNPVGKTEVIITGKGDSLCYDEFSGRYFYSDIDKINKAVNELNRQMRDDMYISLNELYCEFGLDQVKVGDMVGWNISVGNIDLSFSSHIATDGRPCLVIGFTLDPQSDYQTI